MNNLEEKILESINRNELIELTKKLCAIDTQNPPANYQIVHEYIKSLYDSIGLETHVFQGQEGKPNVGGRWPGDGSIDERILLSGHMDVVPVGSGWNISNPLHIEEIDGSLIARGVVDMKGSLAAQFLAVKALKQFGVKLKGDLYLFATVDDETAGDMGLKYVINRGLPDIGWKLPTFHILGEPTDLKLCVAFKGRMWIKIVLTGKSAHGGNPKAGINAIEKMAKLISEILNISRNKHDLMGEDTINIGTINGGEKTNIVADNCSVTIDYRFVSPNDSHQVEDKLKRTVYEFCEQNTGLQFKEFTVFERREPLEVLQSNNNMQLLKNITEEIQKKPTSFNGVLSAGDAYWTITAGIPAVFFGPGSMSVAHTNKECINIDELTNAAKIFALYILRKLC